MKKSFRAVAGALLVVTALLSGCAAPASRETEERICVVTTIYPIWDWVRCLGGEHVTVTLLQDSGVDLHSYQPTVEDMAAITGCDLFVCVGGVSDGWVTDVLNAAGGTQPRILRLLELLDREETPEEETDTVWSEGHALTDEEIAEEEQSGGETDSEDSENTDEDEQEDGETETDSDGDSSGTDDESGE